MLYYEQEVEALSGTIFNVLVVLIVWNQGIKMKLQINWIQTQFIN